MLSATNLGHHFGARTLFASVNFQLYENEKIALVGKNGIGKTTLFHILTNQINPSEGEIASAANYRIGMLSQFFEGDDNKTVREESYTVFKQYFENKKELERLEKELERTSNPQLLDKIESLNSYFSFQNVNPEKEVELTLKGLGFNDLELDQKLETFSGGWKMRVELAKLILSKYDLILLDEPTNHLDIEAIIWFEKFLQNHSGSFILISHDKSFLNNTAKKVFELSNQKLNIYQGNYDKYLIEKEERFRILNETAKNQQKKLENTQKLVDRFRAKATKAKMAKSLEKQIARTEIIEVDSEELKSFTLKFPSVKRAAREVFRIDKMSKSFGDKLVLNEIDMLIERGDKVSFIGQNGTGKSTLLKIITSRIEASSGRISIGTEVDANYFAQDQADQLDTKLTVFESISYAAEEKYSSSLRKILGAFLFSGDEIDKKVSVLSGGEKTRLAIACMMVRDANVIIMDEPTNHLDIHSKEVLKSALKQYEGTVIVVSHDREFLKGLSNKTFEFRKGELVEHLGDIDYVLEKRKTDFRAFQMGTSKPEASSKGQAKISKLSYEERKKMQRKISKHERAIGKLETVIAEIHQQLTDPEIFKSPKGESLMKDLATNEETLTKEMELWEQSVNELEAES